MNNLNTTCFNIGSLTLEKVDLDDKNHLELLQSLLLENNEFSGFIRPLFSENFSGNGASIYSSHYIVSLKGIGIGYVYISNLDSFQRVSLNYVIESSFRGKHYGKLLLTEISEFLFQKDIHIKEIELYIENSNCYSKKVALDVGFQKQGLFHYRIDRSFCPHKGIKKI